MVLLLISQKLVVCFFKCQICHIYLLQENLTCPLCVVLDTAAGVWCDAQAIITNARADGYNANVASGDTSFELIRRCRHAMAAAGNLVYVYGGLCGGKK